ncbi:phosphatidylglycerol lysyltransferase domain-containing protein [Paenibacillus macerans]|uniref:phosphatidylglycerol lysyltransferase domain-containing protein n=1 Tax=Paenibacillus macerans TaxID=44252 RepID=UPI003D321D9F
MLDIAPFHNERHKSHEHRLHRLLQSCGHNSHTHLYYLGDKTWFWDMEHEACLAYRRAGNRCIVLGDPLGQPEAIPRVIAQFTDSCRVNGHIPVFYQAKASLLPLYRQFGFDCLKIGEEAQVHLPEFHLSGKAWLKLRNRMSKLQRTGFSFDVLLPPYEDRLLDRLQAVSEEWLGQRKEKSFSVGAFSRDYVNRFPVAVLLGPDGECEAFASLGGDLPMSPTVRQKPAVARQMTVDLMRYTKACPHGAMDVLFASLFLWAKERQYDYCSLGVAPLANALDLPMAKWIYKYGNRIYNFKGLYDYKNKFAPVWRDVYLVYPPSAMPLTLALLIRMIHTPITCKEDPQQHSPHSPDIL